MGKATIVEEKGEGLYTVDLDYGSDEIQAKIDAALAENVEVQASIDDMLPRLVVAGNASRDADAAVNSLIDALAPGELTSQDLEAALELGIRSRRDYVALQDDLALLRARLASNSALIARLQAEPVTERRDAWCATYTEGAEGVVGTIEVNGETLPQIIAPEAPQWTASDGVQKNRLAMSPVTTFLNSSLLPGWQKFAPTYRVGLISAIDQEADTCNVSLVAALSSAQSLDINRDEILLGVPIEYLDCNSAVFQEGDRVVVQFTDQDWTQPKVIGFESNPRPCTADIWVSANRRDYNASGFTDDRVTVRLSPSDLSIIETYYWITAGTPNDTAQSAGTAYTLRGGSVINLKTNGSALMLPTNGTALAIGGSRIYTLTLDFFSVQAHSWPGGVFESSAQLPSRTIDYDTQSLEVDKCMAADGSALAVAGYMQGFGGGNDIIFRVYNPDLSLRWSVTEVEDTGLDTKGVAITPDYALLLYTLDDMAYTNRIVIRDVDDGSHVRTIDMPIIGLVPFPRDITVRGSDLYLLTEVPGAVTGSEYRRDVKKFDLLTGSPDTPDVTATDVHGAYREPDDWRLVDKGSMD